MEEGLLYAAFVTSKDLVGLTSVWNVGTRCTLSVSLSQLIVPLRTTVDWQYTACCVDANYYYICYVCLGLEIWNMCFCLLI